VQFGKANVADANLDLAYLQHNNLSQPVGLAQGQLERACGDANTKLPLVSICRPLGPVPQLMTEVTAALQP
jgi:hypothetical protein